VAFVFWGGYCVCWRIYIFVFAFEVSMPFISMVP